MITSKKKKSKETLSLRHKRISVEGQSAYRKVQDKVYGCLQQLKRNIPKKMPDDDEVGKLRTLHGRCQLLVKDDRHRRRILEGLEKGILLPEWPLGRPEGQF